MAAKQQSLTDKEKETARGVFDALDANHDGKITTSDLKKALNDGGHKPTEDELKEMIKQADTDGDGTVSWPEFLKICEGRPYKERVEASLRKVFDDIDKDKSGTLDRSEIRTLLKEAGIKEQYTDQQIDDIIKAIDTSGDGKVSFEEFISVFLA